MTRTGFIRLQSVAIVVLTIALLLAAGWHRYQVVSLQYQIEQERSRNANAA